jgi:hypothetical protein
MENLRHSASVHSEDNNAPSNHGIKQMPADTKDDDLPVEMAPLKRSSTLSIRACVPKERLCAEYAPLQLVAPKPRLFGKID